MKLGDFIRLYREKNNLTMQEFANRASLSKGYVSMLEKGKQPQNQRALTPSLETVNKVANAVGMSLDELISELDGNECVNIPAAPAYYLDPEAAEIAQQVFERPQLKVLFDASRKVSAEDLDLVISMLDRMKKDEGK